jgi:uncharacterized membrane protein
VVSICSRNASPESIEAKASRYSSIFLRNVLEENKELVARVSLISITVVELLMIEAVKSHQYFLRHAFSA